MIQMAEGVGKTSQEMGTKQDVRQEKEGKEWSRQEEKEGLIGRRFQHEEQRWSFG